MIKKYKQIHTMAYPILLNYLLSSVFELLDKAIVGHYSVQGFALVGVAASFTYAVTGALGILSAAFNIVAADEKGRDHLLGFETAFVISRGLSLLIGAGFFVLSLLGGRCFFRRAYGISEEHLSELLSYFYPTAFTVIQNMLIFQYSAYFRNRLNTKITLYGTMVSTAVNLFFDFSLVYGAFGLPRLGTAGAAWGSVIGLAAGLLVYQAAYYREHTLPHIFSRLRRFHGKRTMARRILRLYPPLLGQELLEGTIFVIVVSGTVARLGTEQMAVYNLLDTVGSAIGLPIYAYASATQTLALQGTAARNQAAVRDYLKSGIQSAFAVVLLLCVLCGCFSGTLLRLIVTDTTLITAAQGRLWPVFLLQLVKVPYQIHLCYLQGIGRERFVFVCTAVGTVAASLGVAATGIMTELSGIFVWMIAEATLLGLVYRKKMAELLKFENKGS
ncbi:MAG: MATE family efflux transporter [Roseburia sp.]|nr:MATE family efflux transporter [Roseburia sp.]